jgi:hypothetical protein
VNSIVGSDGIFSALGGRGLPDPRAVPSHVRLLASGANRRRLAGMSQVAGLQASTAPISPLGSRLHPTECIDCSSIVEELQVAADS